MNLQPGDQFSVEYQVTEKVYQGFIDTFHDRNPLHTDDHYARQKKFSGKVMHGAILTGFLSHFVGECLPEKNVVLLSYKIAFRKPVYLGDHLKLQATVAGISSAVQGAEIRYQFINSGGIVVSSGDIAIKLI
jgi:3-hydroxybutyryl-CoA dehydratase